MRLLLPLFVAMILLVLACEKDDEVLPVPSPAANTTTETAPEIIEEHEGRPTVDVDSEFFQIREFREMPYRILIPRDYVSTKDYPLHIFLHGLGERGKDNKRQLSIGASYFLSDSIRQNYPAFIVYPQCPSGEYWFDDAMLKKLKHFIDTLALQYPIAMREISIGGFSMGAYCTFAMVAEYPGLFEAAVAIAGDGDQGKAALMAKSRWHIYAGKKDDVVPSHRTQEMAEALEKAGASVSFTLFPNADHGSTWVHAFSQSDFFSWLFSSNSPKLPEELIKNKPVKSSF